MAAAHALIFVAVSIVTRVGIPLLILSAGDPPHHGRRSCASIMFVWMASSAPPMECVPGSTSGSTWRSARVDARSCYRIVLFGLLCGALFTGVIGSFGARFVWIYGRNTDQVSTTTSSWPTWIVYLAIPGWQLS